MAWQTEMVRIVRHLINDLDDTNYTFSQNRLEETVLVSAQIVLSEVSFVQTYTVDVDGPTLEPDPTLPASRDNNFITLVCMKSACVIDRARFRANVGQGIRIKDGDSEIDTTTAFKGHEILLKQGNCAEYEKLKYDYELGNSVGGEAILSPFNIGVNLPDNSRGEFFI